MNEYVPQKIGLFMSRKPDDVRRACTWNNGQKAVVHLIECSDGAKVVQKIYRPRFAGWMFRESLSIWYLSRSLRIVPRLIRFRPWRHELLLSYVQGERVLEWVLQYFGPKNLDLRPFRNCESLESPVILEAFVRFRNSNSEEAARLKESIRQSYGELHGLGWQHGASNPRNLIYDGERIYIIDFDHARPSLAPGRYDHVELKQWFGLDL